VNATKVREFVLRTTAESGVPERVEDAAGAQVIATILRDLEGGDHAATG
jgi:hypothetical protein